MSATIKLDIIKYLSNILIVFKHEYVISDQEPAWAMHIKTGTGNIPKLKNYY